MALPESVQTSWLEKWRAQRGEGTAVRAAMPKLGRSRRNRSYVWRDAHHLAEEYVAHREAAGITGRAPRGHVAKFLTRRGFPSDACSKQHFARAVKSVSPQLASPSPASKRARPSGSQRGSDDGTSVVAIAASDVPDCISLVQP